MYSITDHRQVSRTVKALRTNEADEPRHIQSGAAESPSTRKWALEQLSGIWHSISFYVRHPAFLPSFSLSLLYLTVLSFGAQMIAYLVAVGFTSTSIGLLRTVSAVCELSATWIAPATMDRIGAIRAGIWLLNWQILCIASATIALWVDTTPVIAATGLLMGVIASRVGLWGFDLSAQLLIQEVSPDMSVTGTNKHTNSSALQEVQPDQRGRFSAIEASVQNSFELCSFALTIGFSHPSQFKYPSTISACAVIASGLLYAAFVRRRRGHLLHASRCMKSRQHKESLSHNEGGAEWRQIPQHELDDI